MTSFVPGTVNSASFKNVRRHRDGSNSKFLVSVSHEELFNLKEKQGPVVYLVSILTSSTEVNLVFNSH